MAEPMKLRVNGVERTVEADPATTLRTRSASQTRRGTRGLICM